MPVGGGWVLRSLRWLWGADDAATVRELLKSTPATWVLLALFSAVSIADMVVTGSLHESGPVIERLGHSSAHLAAGQWWRFITVTLINDAVVEPPLDKLAHLLSNAFLFVLTAPRVERAFGSLRTVVLFVVASIAGTVGDFVGAPFYWKPGGGTSQAAYGFVGGVLVLAFVRRRRSRGDAIFFWIALALLVASTATVAPALSEGTNITHLAGFIAGVVLATVWHARPASLRVGLSVAAALVLVGAALAAVRTLDVRRSDLAIHSETPLGFAPLMIERAFGSLWVTGGEGRVEADLVRIDAETGRVVARIREPGISGLFVVTKDRIWVAGKGTVIAVDPVRNRVVSRIRLRNGAWPWSVAATDGALWAAVSESGEVIRIDLRTRKQKAVKVGAGAFVVTASGSNVWATSHGTQTVSRLDEKSGVVRAQKRLPNAPYHLAPAGGSLWVGAQPFVYRLHPESLAILAEVDTGQQTWHLTQDAAGELIVPQRFARSIVRLNPNTNSVARRVEVGLRQPISAAVVGDDLWIADPFTNSVARMSDS